MPIENERKYLLDMSSIDEISTNSIAKKQIKQGYLSKSARIRSTNQDNVISYFFTFKKLVDKKLVEIETLISKKDFEKLWTVAKFKIKKIRYLYEKWEIDFFYKKKKLYLAMAEIEMAEDEDEPKTIPKLIKKYIIYNVPRNNVNFCNINLTKKKSKKLYKEFKQ